jgi:hypothetical protein
MADATKETPTRAELVDAPPFLSWRAIYLLVLGALAVEIVLGAALTAIAR